MIDRLINNCRKILIQDKLFYIAHHLDELEDINLVGQNTKEVMSMPPELLHGFSYPENFFAIKKLEHRERITLFAQKFPALFSSAPCTYPKARFIEEILCEKVLPLSDEECVEAISFLQTRYETESYEYFRHYLTMRENLKDEIDLGVCVEIRDGFVSTYDIAEKETEKVIKNARMVRYERSV